MIVAYIAIYLYIKIFTSFLSINTNNNEINNKKKDYKLLIQVGQFFGDPTSRPKSARPSDNSAKIQLAQTTTRPKHNSAKILLSSSRVDWYKREVFWPSCVLAKL